MPVITVFPCRLRRVRVMLTALYCALLLLFAVSAPVNATVTTGSMTVPRMMHGSAALPDGRILVTGGYAKPGTAPYASAEIYDPFSGLFTAATPMQQARTQHASVTLSDGRVMVVGGSIVTSPSLVGTNTAEIYDPATGQWSYTGNLNVARARSLARLLPGGKVFVMNKDGYSGTPFAEVWDPQTGIFTKTGNMVNVTGWHGLVVLADGRVMKIGGYGSQYMNQAEIWDPATNLWSATGAMAEARQDISPVLLPDGKVLVAGGSNVVVAVNTVEIYDPTTGQFSPGVPMPISTKVHSSSVLPNGDIILLGDYSQYLARYQPGSQQWNLTGPRRGTPRETNVSVLPGGNLLIDGGAALNDATAYAAVWDGACAPQKITLKTTSFNADFSGGAVNISVTGAPGCRFEVVDLPSWLTATSLNPYVFDQAGVINVSLTATPNLTGASRSAAISVGNSTFTVNQAVDTLCTSTPSLSSSVFNFGYPANSGSISVTAVAACAWNFNSLPAWITPTSATSGSGNGIFTFTVAANTGSARSASGMFTGSGAARSLTFNQDAVSPCMPVPTLSAYSFNFVSGAQTGTIVVTAPAACSWTITLPPWVSNTTSLSGIGNGSIGFSVSANLGLQRSASGQISGLGFASTFNMVQAGSLCASWSLNPSVLSLANTASNGSLAINAPAGCTWNLTGLPSWISLTASTGSGSGSVGYSVAANTGVARSATATLSGSGPALTLSVSQAAGPSAPVAYCAARGTNTTYEYIQSVSINSVTSTSGGQGYNLFVSPVFAVAAGKNTISLTPKFSSSSYPEGWAVFIDLNQDGLFTADERLLNVSSTSAVYSSITIPTTAKTGLTRLRVVMQYASTAPSACNTFTYGEVEDYTVSIQ